MSSRVCPVFGDASRRDRRRLERCRGPSHLAVRVDDSQRGDRAAVGGLPPLEDHERSIALAADPLLDQVIDVVVVVAPTGFVRDARTHGDGLLGLGEMQHHIGDAPPRCVGRRRPLRDGQPLEHRFQLRLLGLEVGEDVHAQCLRTVCLLSHHPNDHATDRRVPDVRSVTQGTGGGDARASAGLHRHRRIGSGYVAELCRDARRHGRPVGAR